MGGFGALGGLLGGENGTRSTGDGQLDAALSTLAAQVRAVWYNRYGITGEAFQVRGSGNSQRCGITGVVLQVCRSEAV